MLRRCLSRFEGAKRLEELCRGNRVVTRLANGMRVLSYDDHTGVSGISLAARIGTRYETDRTAGATAVLQAGTLLGNEKRDEGQLCRDLHALGSSFRTSSELREAVLWHINVPRYQIRGGVEFLENVALHPLFAGDTFAKAREIAAEEAALADRDATRVCFELIHRAAFGGVALGRPGLMVDPTVIERVDGETVREFHAALMQPERATLVASGVSDHDGLVRAVEELFKWPERPRRSLEYAQDIGYVGGELLLANDKAPESVTKFQEKNLTHVGLCFKGIPLRHPDYFVYTMIQTMLGGGSTFSSGGPGKGMHTKLFREVVARSGWLNGVECVSAWYEKAGLIGLYGSAEHQFAKHLVKMMLYQAATIPERITDRDVEMARNQLLSQLVLLGEARDTALDEASKLLLQHDTVTLPEDLMRGAEKVTLADFRRVSKTMLESAPTVVVYGNVADQMPFEQVSVMLKEFGRRHGTG